MSLAGAVVLHALGAAALEPPLTASVLGTKSSQGTFLVEVRGASSGTCTSIASKLHVDHGPSIAVSEVAPCLLAVVPAAPAPPSRYCINIDDFAGSYGERCIDVTGTASDLGSARVAPLENVGPDSWGQAACRPCDDQPAQSACVQRQRELRVSLKLTGTSPELLSSHVFAAIASDKAAPDSKDWFALSATLERNVLLPEKSGEAQACLRVYARRADTGASTELGRACLDTVAPAAVPSEPVEVRASCEAGYRRRWCDVNLASCGSAGSARAPVMGCEGYAKFCGATPPATAGGSDAGASTPEPDAEASSDDESGDGDADPDRDAGQAAPARRKRAGCQLGTGASAPGLSPFAALSLLALALRRRRPRARD